MNKVTVKLEATNRVALVKVVKTLMDLELKKAKDIVDVKATASSNLCRFSLLFSFETDKDSKRIKEDIDSCSSASITACEVDIIDLSIKAQAEELLVPKVSINDILIRAGYVVIPIAEYDKLKESSEKLERFKHSIKDIGSTIKGILDKLTDE